MPDFHSHFYQALKYYHEQQPFFNLLLKAKHLVFCLTIVLSFVEITACQQSDSQTDSKPTATDKKSTKDTTDARDSQPPALEKETKPSNKDETLPIPIPSFSTQAESLYQNTFKTTSEIAVYKGGSFNLEKVPTPGSLKELLVQLSNNWAIPVSDRQHPVTAFFITLHRQSPLQFKGHAISLQNQKSCYMAYALLTGETHTEPIADFFKSELAGDYHRFMGDATLEVQWTNDGRALLLITQHASKRLSLPAPAPAPAPAKSDFQIGSRLPTVNLPNPELKTARNTEPAKVNKKTLLKASPQLSDNLQLMDNALGKINTTIVFYNRYLPYKTLLSICKNIFAHITIVTVPNSTLLQNIESQITRLEQGKIDIKLIEAIVNSSENHAGELKEDITELGKQTANADISNKAAALIVNWQKLRDQLFFELSKTHQANLIKRLESDGINEDRFTIINSSYLESRWARDYFLLGSNQKRQPVIFESSLQLLNRNTDLAKDLLAQKGFFQKWGRQDIRLPFEGGDLRAIGPYLFMGENTFFQGVNKIETLLNQSPSLLVGSTTIEKTKSTEPSENNHFVIVASKTDKPLQTEKQKQTTVEAVLKQEYQTLFGRSLVVVGEGDDMAQPMVHLDTFITFLPDLNGDRPTVMVADLAETIKILEALSTEDKAELARSILVSSLTATELGRGSTFELYRGLFLKHDLIQLLLHGGLDRLIQVYKQSPLAGQMQHGFNATAKWLENQKFKVVRTPTLALPLGNMNYFARSGQTAYLKTIQEKTQRIYNNGLVEVYLDQHQKQHKTVYLPKYGFTPIEKRLMERYQQLGFKVIFIPYMWETGWGRGAVDCLTSEIRSPLGLPSH